jgi:hypothetical protein
MRRVVLACALLLPACSDAQGALHDALGNPVETGGTDSGIGADGGQTTIFGDAGGEFGGGGELGGGGGTADGSTANDDDGGVAEGDAGQALPSLKPKCVQKDSQVIVIGDSYINWPSHTFPQDMANESGQNWRMEAIGGMSMATGGVGGPLGEYIPNQFDDAIASDPDAHTVLMDGGGNDVLVGWTANPDIEQCKDTGSSQLAVCQKVVSDAIAAADKLLNRMAAAGIRDVVYFFYPHIPEGRSIGGPHPNEILDYALPMVRDFCNGAADRTDGKLRCHFIDMIPVFEGHNPEWFNSDIHENSDGSKAMAKKVWEVMTDACVAQKAGTVTCCE